MISQPISDGKLPLVVLMRMSTCACTEAIHAATASMHEQRNCRLMGDPLGEIECNECLISGFAEVVVCRPDNNGAENRLQLQFHKSIISPTRRQSGICLLTIILNGKYFYSIASCNLTLYHAREEVHLTLAIEKYPSIIVSTPAIAYPNAEYLGCF